ncbi:MAG: hypothetical protein J6X28_00010 [Bacilli bacterium]|nr:hypothetical protein [Bacilli bacterium]
MGKDEYSDIVFLEKMNEIKATIRNSGFRVNYRKAYDTDLKMREIVDHLYDKNASDQSLIDLYHRLDENIERRAICTLTYYYFALYQDNMDLLKNMVKEGVTFMDDEGNYCFELLDRDFTQYFDEDFYLFLVKNCREELCSFYQKAFSHVPARRDAERRKELLREIKRISEKLYSTKEVPSLEEKRQLEDRLEEISEEIKTFTKNRYSEDERKQLCEKFASIMKLDPFVAKITEEEKSYQDPLYPSLLTPEVFSVFSTQEIVNMIPSQKNMVSENVHSPLILGRLKQIIQKYPDYASNLKLNPEILRLLSDEDLYHFPNERAPMYERASTEGITTRYHMVLQKNETIQKYPGVISNTIFEALSNEELEGLSEKGLERIHHLVFHAHLMNDQEKYRLQRSSVRIMKMDRFVQKVKKILS